MAPQPQGIVIRRGAEIAGSDTGRPGVSSRDSSRGSRGDSDSGSTPEAASSKGSEGLIRQALAGALGRPIGKPHQQGAGGAEGTLELSIVGTPSLPSSAQKSTTRAAVKRKVDTQTKVGEELRQSQVSGGGKKARNLENSGTPKRVSFRKILPKEDGPKQVEESKSPKGRGKITPGGESTEIKEKKAGEGKTQSGQPAEVEKLATGASSAGGPVEANTGPRQSTIILPRLEQALARAREKVALQGPESQQSQAYAGGEDNRCVEWLLEDAIQKLKAGTFQSVSPARPL